MAAQGSIRIVLGCSCLSPGLMLKSKHPPQPEKFPDSGDQRHPHTHHAIPDHSSQRKSGQRPIPASQAAGFLQPSTTRSGGPMQCDLVSCFLRHRQGGRGHGHKSDPFDHRLRRRGAARIAKVEFHILAGGRGKEWLLGHGRRFIRRRGVAGKKPFCSIPPRWHE